MTSSRPVSAHLIYDHGAMEALVSDDLVAFVKDALARAEAGQSQLSEEVLALKGMSGRKTRHAFNNLCARPNTRYLELGCYLGSTLISALYLNAAVGVGVDDFMQFVKDKPRETLQENLRTYLQHGQYR